MSFKIIDRQKFMPEVETAIVKAVERNTSYREIPAQFNDPKGTITNVIKLFRATGGVQCRFTPGRPQVSTTKQEKLLIRLSKRPLIETR
jgi:transposase